MSNSARDTQFQGFAKALMRDLDDVSTTTYASLDKAKEAYKLAIARRAYDLSFHSTDYCLEYLHRLGIETSGDLGKRIMPSIPDMTELPKEQE